MGEANNLIELDISRPQELDRQLDKKDLKIILLGRVPKRVGEAVADVTLDVFKKMDFNGVPPKKISISDGSVILPSGEEVPSCYEGDEEPKKPGNILISYTSCEKSFSWIDRIRIPDYVRVAAYAAHEAVHHVQVMKGEKTLGSSKMIPIEIHVKEKSEQEANRIAKEVIAERYGWGIIFGGEFYLKGKETQ